MAPKRHSPRLAAGALAAIAIVLSACGLDNDPSHDDSVDASESTSVDECLPLFGEILEQRERWDSDLPPECEGYFGRLTTGACLELRDLVCGDDDRCAESEGCAAALRLAMYEDGQDLCLVELEQVTLTRCDPTPVDVDYCAVLVEHVCGSPEGDRACNSAPACLQAKLMRTNEEDENCQQALAERSLFPRCPD